MSSILASARSFSVMLIFAVLCQGCDPTTHETLRVGVDGSGLRTTRFTVNAGGSKSFIIVPDPGYLIKDVTVDGRSVGPVATYMFNGINMDHTIEATFVPK
ncbi:MAG TPA: hypothetical protein VJB59_15440 [Bdellovibrionota bacterium]|nr:hypothetical protein [Bdellovibrionota bacterium]